MHDIAMAALSVFLTQSLALLAPAPHLPHIGAPPGSAGILPAWTHWWAFGPLAGGTPALPGASADRVGLARGDAK